MVGAVCVYILYRPILTPHKQEKDIKRKREIERERVLVGAVRLCRERERVLVVALCVHRERERVPVGAVYAYILYVCIEREKEYR